MKIFLIIPSILTVAVAQQPSVNCTYFFYGTEYTCYLIINNPNGFNNFTEIGGIHLEGFTNADVGHVYRTNGGSSNVPSIISDTFPNIRTFDLYNSGLTTIDDNAFGGCSQITNLYLYSNSISLISTNAFVNLRNITYIDLDSNFLTTLPENVFANQQSLTDLNLNSNPFEDIPADLFRPLENLQYLLLMNDNISAFNNQWFAANGRLSQLILSDNRIVLAANSFAGLGGLRNLNLAFNGISEIPPGAFLHLPNLQTLNLYGNNLQELQADSFPDLEHLNLLDIGRNSIEVIHDGAFRGLANLSRLYLDSCILREFNSNSFEGLTNLGYIYFEFNLIEELPPGVFAPLENIFYLGSWNNRFGSLAILEIMDLESNVINALDQAIIDDAVNLSTLYFGRNLCASGYFGNFRTSKEQYLPILERRFQNFKFIVDTTTEADQEFSFFEGPQPGIALRVNTNSEAHIALTPLDFVWNPIVEILIGTTNNTRSVIRVNQETNVVTVPTPNILTGNQWNDFRVTWANQVVLVYRGNDTFPFMAYTMQDFFPVNFYGLRAVETSAVWTVQPFD